MTNVMGINAASSEGIDQGFSICPWVIRDQVAVRGDHCAQKFTQSYIHWRAVVQRPHTDRKELTRELARLVCKNVNQISRQKSVR
jgi:hypothetical protein